MGGASADITFEPTSIPGDVSIDTVEVEGTTYHVVSVADFPLLMSGEYATGEERNLLFPTVRTYCRWTDRA